MGCDIHMFVEKKNSNGQWEAVKGKNPWFGKWRGEEEFSYSWLYDGRCYSLFSLLADVRNGISSWRDEPATGHYIKPICEPKGIPEDISEIVKEDYNEWYEDAHSASWLTLKELLDYDWNTIIKFVKLVGKEEYKEFKKNGSPNSWCGGSSALLISNKEMEDYIEGKIKFDKDFIQTVITWEKPISEFDGGFYECLDELKELSNDPENIRIVFWFDN